MLSFNEAALMSLFLSFYSSALVQSVQSMSLSVSPAQTAAWRKQIFEQLSERTRREIDNFKHYEQAIEQVPSQPCTLPPVSFISMSFDSFT